MAAHSLPYLRVEGSPFERGRQLGLSCGDLIGRYPAFLLSQINDDPGGLHGQVPLGFQQSRRLTIEELRLRASSFLPSLRAWVPELVAEMEGMAQGAQLPIEDVLIVNLRGELIRESMTVETGCTALAATGRATASSKAIVGQNLDGDPRLRDLLLVLHVLPDSGGQTLMLTFAGLVGYHGLGETIGAAATAGSVGAWAEGLPHYPYKRLVLQQRSLGDALQLTCRYPFSSAGNYVFADSGGAILGLEIVPDAMPAELSAGEDVVVHTNHFLSEAFAPREALLEQFPDSPTRLAEAHRMIRSSHGGISVESIAGMLRSHTSGPASICRHTELETIGSFIAEPATGSFAATIGSPCMAEYERFELA